MHRRNGVFILRLNFTTSLVFSSSFVSEAHLPSCFKESGARFWVLHRAQPLKFDRRAPDSEQRLC